METNQKPVFKFEIGQVVQHATASSFSYKFVITGRGIMEDQAGSSPYYAVSSQNMDGIVNCQIVPETCLKALELKS